MRKSELGKWQANALIDFIFFIMFLICKGNGTNSPHTGRSLSHASSSLAAADPSTASKLFSVFICEELEAASGDAHGEGYMRVDFGV